VVDCLGISTSKTNGFQSSSATKHASSTFNACSYRVYENEMVIPMLLNLTWWELSELAALGCTKVRAHEISSDRDVADVWVEVHLEHGTRKPTGGLDLLPGPH